MRLTSCTDLLALFVLLAKITSASPIPFGRHGHRNFGTTSPHIFCITWDDLALCEKFKIPIVRRQSTQPSTRNAYSITVIGPGHLISEEDR